MNNSWLVFFLSNFIYLRPFIFVFVSMAHWKFIRDDSDTPELHILYFWYQGDSTRTRTHTHTNENERLPLLKPPSSSSSSSVLHFWYHYSLSLQNSFLEKRVESFSFVLAFSYMCRCEVEWQLTLIRLRSCRVEQDIVTASCSLVPVSDHHEHVCWLVPAGTVVHACVWEMW